MLQKSTINNVKKRKLNLEMSNRSKSSSTRILKLLNKDTSDQPEILFN